MAEVVTNLCMTDVQFEQGLSLFIDRVSNFDFRLSELIEFHAQWKKIFDTLKLRYGFECTVAIKNNYVYESFVLDKFQMLIIDIHSYSCNLLDKASFANGCLDYIHKLPYPLLYTTNQQLLEAKYAEIKSFSLNIGDLKERIRLIRNYFGHKHKDSMISSIKKNGLFDTTIDIYLQQIKLIVKEFIRFIENLYLVSKGSTFHFGSYTPSISVSNQIDLIIFGNIAGALHELNKVGNAADCYDKVRETYFASDRFLEYVSNLPVYG